jgi:hypothetical protein
MKKVTLKITFNMPTDMFWDLPNLIDRLKHSLRQTIAIDDGKLLAVEVVDE